MSKKRFAFVGTGGRAISFIEPLVTTYRATNELVAICDLSPARMAYYNEMLAGVWAHHAVPAYPAAQFDEMLRKEKPDTVFVCSIDSTHHDYIVRALHADCDVITEKPLTIDAAKCRAILEAQRATGRRVRVAFNYRWAPFRTKVKELIASGIIGKVRSVNLEYLLDTNHGADYFRRWHSHAADSGTLLVHKSTHHFDLVNWWLDAIPAQVFAYGDLVFYGRQNAEARGDGALTKYPRYTGHPEAKTDPFYLDLDEKPGAEAEGEWIKVFPHFLPSYVVPVPAQSGAHGGADEILCRSFYAPDAPATDPWGRFAGHEQGAASILVGIAGVESIKRNLPVNLDDLVPLRPRATRLSELV